MRKLNLQLFAEEKLEAVQGSRIIYLYRLFSKQTTEAAKNIAFSTENENTMSQDAESTATKDGSIRTPGAIEVELTGTSVMAKNSTLYSELKSAMHNSELVELWEVNLDEPGDTLRMRVKLKLHITKVILQNYLNHHQPMDLQKYLSHLEQMVLEQMDMQLLQKNNKKLQVMCSKTLL